MQGERLARVASLCAVAGVLVIGSGAGAARSAVYPSSVSARPGAGGSLSLAKAPAGLQEAVSRALAPAGVLDQQGSKLAPDAGGSAAAAGLGSAVALSEDGDTALIADPDYGDFGAAWVFVWNGSAWVQQGPTLTGPVGYAFGESASLSADGSTALVGAVGVDGTPAGEAFVFARSGTGWVLQAILAEPDATYADLFGLSVALSGDGETAAVGSPGSLNGGEVWVYGGSGGSWTQQGSALTPNDAGHGPVGAFFGGSVALSSDGDTLLVGGENDSTNGGAAWAFTRSGSTWTQQGSKLTASAATAQFGESVALSSDGNTALIGEVGDDHGAGAAWVFTRSGSTWTQQGSKLVGGGEVNSPNAGEFGQSVALSSDGNTALIGGQQDNGLAGAAWVFTRSGSTWTQAGSKLTGSGGASQQEFGLSVALSGDGTTAFIGGPEYRSGSGPWPPGGGWMFTQSGGVWGQEGSPLDPVESPASGFSVAISSDGTTALIGGPGANQEEGAAWVFTQTGGVWSEQATLTPSDATSPGYAGQFGWSVALSADGDTALVGGPTDNDLIGSAWVFTRSGSTWTQQGPKLSPTGAIKTVSTAVEFGASVALSSDGTTALIGGYYDNTGVGAAWVFTESGGTWTQEGSPLRASDEDNSGGGGEFGASVALSADGTTAIIGGPGDGGSNQGAAWIFTQSGSSWSQDGSKLTPSDEDNSGGGGLFGNSVALSADGDTALIGGPADGSEGQGAAWVFTRSGSSWTQQGSKLLASDEDNTGGGGGFGSALALSSDGNTALIGGQFDDAEAGGAAWIFTRTGSTWSQDGPKLVPTDEDNSGDGGEFGFSAALSSDGSTALIGGPDDGAYSAGAAWAFTAPPATAPGAPTNVSAAAGNAQATVSFQAPASNGGAPISTYTVTASPGSAQATGASSPITVTGLTNGTSYTFTVTATNRAGTGPVSAPSSPVTPSAPPVAHGGGGGGGGSDGISVSMSPASQSIAAGGTATFSVSITNSGAGYLFDVGASDSAAPNCDQATALTPAATLATLETMAPGVTVTYSCSVTVSSSLTNTVTASGIGPDAVTVTATASGSVTVSGSPAPFTPPVSGGSGSSKSTTPTPAVSSASLTVSGLKSILIGKKLSLHLTTKLSAASLLDLVLLDSKGQTLTRWVIHAKKGTHVLTLLLVSKARQPGHDTLKITETGDKKPRSFPLTLRI